ncbi:penicillin acylase family protein [Fischerella thermalis CCMEE 5268]|uniref:Penicillin acylase family protein n=1 Tax=Fischerella thermalis CCMEE 5268 TaxID=2019662 RepID=A0A2N6KBI1_9CYAN|nr:penicillin acylase family protein [Fischerella thermalis]PLZ95872.1 penicillin acylase family protein [Fischerella thermalis CCMEE 5268]
MQKLFKSKILKLISISILVITLIISSAIAYTICHSWPQESGKITLPGLQAQVEVQRDQLGIPHIYAQNTHDLFMAQGYIHAQDRFWQMDFWRHIGSGRLAEMFGQSQLNTDKFLRTLGWARVAQTEIQQMDTETKNILQAYADGINTYLANRQDSGLSLEYTVLKLLNPNYKPEPWQILHTLTWGKVMSYDLGDNLDTEIERSILLKTLTSQQVDQLIPPYPADHPLIVGSTEKAVFLDREVGKARDGESLILSFPHHPYPTGSRAEHVYTPSPHLSLALGRGNGIGSNNWVISGQRTATGKPILANDPHLGVQMPSIWYEVGLHCLPKTALCPYDVAGFSFPGMAGVIIGHNDRISWGVTNLEADVMDLFIEKINPNNPNQYEINGKWVDMELLTENIQVAGSQSVTQTVRYTRHGPIISDTFAPLKNFHQTAGINLPANYALALRWTALEPSTLASAIIKINLSQNWQEFRAGVRDFDVPAQNFVYADIDGNIGYQMPGKIPVRRSGDGRYPIPGWTDDFEWQEYIPFEKLPTVFNPESGYIVTANNAVTGKDYPYLISSEWDYGFRAQRIVEMIAEKNNSITIADVKKMQADNKNLIAENIVPILLEIPLANSRLEKIQRLLVDWDFQQNSDSTAGAIFAVFWKHLLAETFADQLPQGYLPTGSSRWFAVIRELVKQPNSDWWDNYKTPVVENRDQIFQQAFAQAVDELEGSLSKDTSRWHWGNLHTVTFRNQTLGKSGIAPIEALFNRGPFPSAGGSSIVNATGWNAAKDYTVVSLPSMRMIVDLANWDNSVAIQTTGQSGHAFHRHYDDMIQPWRQFKYHPMLWQQEKVASSATKSLMLMP